MVSERLAAVRRRMAAAAERTGRDVDGVTLVAVSKGHDPEVIMEAYAAGHRVFGENRSTELSDKAQHLPEDIVWHFVGQLQSRKARDVAPLAAAIHSVDRRSVIERLGAAAEPGAPPNVYIQVNVAGEDQKGGAAVDEVPEIVAAATAAGLTVIGLMTMPPLVDDPEDNRRWFAELRELRDVLRVDHPRLTGLSMGMTDDFEVAIEEGASAIRVGRAIFGERSGGRTAGLPSGLMTSRLRDED